MGNSSRSWVLVFGVAIVGIIVAQFLATRPNASQHGIPDWVNVTGKIERRAWSEFGQTDFWPTVADEIASYRTPFILTGSPVEIWPARYSWKNTSYLVSTVETLHQTKVANYSLFVYEQDIDSNVLHKLAREQGMEDIRVPPPTKSLENCTLEEFFRCEHSRCSSLYRYYSRKANSADDFGKIIRDIQPIGDFVVHNDWMDCRQDGKDKEKCAAINNEVLKRAQVHAWLGQPGVETASHFDTSHNFFAQLRGTKRFLVSRPETWVDFLLYGVYHPRSRHSQFDGWKLDSLIHESEMNEEMKDFKIRPTSAQLEAQVMVADLRPGDVLYLPPYYMHRVTALPDDYSVGVNIWTSSKEEVLKDKVEGEAMPTTLLRALDSQRHQPHRDWMLVTRYFREVFQQLDSVKANHDIQQLYNFEPSSTVSQFQYAKRENGDPLGRSFHTLMTVLLHQRFLSRREFATSMGCDHFEPLDCPSDELLPETEVENLRQAATKLVSHFESYFLQIQESPNKSLHRDAGAIADIILIDFLERVSMKTAGLKNVCTFLQCTLLQVPLS